MNPAVTPSIFDTQSLSALRRGLRQDDPQAIKAAARQFEALFLQMMLKSLRTTVPQDGIFESDQTRFYQELLDSQLAQVMATRGGTGLAALIERQLTRPPAEAWESSPEGLPLTAPAKSLPLDGGKRAYPLPAEQAVPALPLQGSPLQPAAPRVSTGALTAESFVAQFWPQAVAASAGSGIPPQFLVAHAALESGWGRSEPRFPDGRPSHNLFGIKAGSHWTGAIVEAVTTEYLNGVSGKRVERFRAYDSYAEAFQDYVRLLTQSPRYAEAVGSRDAAGFARGLQRAGYATDPAYAAKLERIIGTLAALGVGAPRA